MNSKRIGNVQSPHKSSPLLIIICELCCCSSGLVLSLFSQMFIYKTMEKTRFRTASVIHLKNIFQQFTEQCTFLLFNFPTFFIWWTVGMEIWIYTNKPHRDQWITVFDMPANNFNISFSKTIAFMLNCTQQPTASIAIWEKKLKMPMFADWAQAHTWNVSCKVWYEKLAFCFHSYFRDFEPFSKCHSLNSYFALTQIVWKSNKIMYSHNLCCVHEKSSLYISIKSFPHIQKAQQSSPRIYGLCWYAMAAKLAEMSIQWIT